MKSTLFILCLPFGYGEALMSEMRQGPTIGRQLYRYKYQLALALDMKPLSREDEIRRKIVKLKKQGKIKESSTLDDSTSYEDKVKKILGRKKSKLLGFGDSEEEEDEISKIQAELDGTDDHLKDDSPEQGTQARGRIGSLPFLQEMEEGEEQEQPQQQPSTRSTAPAASASSSAQPKNPIIDPSLFEDSKEPEMSEKDLLDLVVMKLSEEREQETPVEEAEHVATEPSGEQKAENGTDGKQDKTTTGVGGAWNPDDGNTTEFYKPKSGSWGAFPRPKDISKAYGGGRRVGVGFSKEDDAISNMQTQKRLKDYRRKVGIDVPTEKEYAAQIEEALQIGQLAMQRGLYSTAVSTLEKVTKWCSTNSKVGSKVFLELAMAYEAVGRTQEANQVYQSLTNCRMEDVKSNARRLLYAMEAMEFMRDVSSDFSRTNIKNTFVDATGLGNIAQNFDDVYQTAYIDLNNGYYKRLTESVVRSNREARLILLKATGKGEVGKMKVVQALRSIGRHFDDALEIEIDSKKQVEPTAFLNGKPLVVSRAASSKTASTTINLDEFVLASPGQMMKNLGGRWRLQLLADKQGDGVSFLNTTTAIQEFSTNTMAFSASGPSGFVTVQCSGEFSMDDSRRTVARSNVQTTGGAGGIFSIFGGGKDSGFLAAVSREQQIVSVDSILLITKCAPGTRKGKNAEKEHFGVWRRVVEGEP
jgi:hypothetical protein